MSAGAQAGTDTHIIEPSFTAKYVTSSIYYVNSRNGTNTGPNLVEGYARQIMVSRILAQYQSLLPEQTAKFRGLFNYYDEYRIVRYTRDWLPNFRQADQNALTTWWAKINESGTEPEDHQNYMHSVAMLDTSTMTFMPDELGLPVRSTYDELYQARARPDAVTFALNKPFRYVVQPTEFDLAQAPVLNIQSTNNGNGRVYTTQSLNQAPGQFFIQSSGVQGMNFVPTKAVNIISGAVQYNWDNPYNGFRWYEHFPMNESISQVQVNIGMMTSELVLEFRKPSYIAPLVVPAMSSFMSLSDVESAMAGLQPRGLPTEDKHGPEFRQGQLDVDVQRDDLKRYMTDEQKEQADQPPTNRAKPLAPL